MFDARIVLKTRQIRSRFIRSRATCPFRDCLGAVPKATGLGNRSRPAPNTSTLMPVYLLESTTVSVLACLDALSLNRRHFVETKGLLPRSRKHTWSKTESLNRVFGWESQLELQSQ